MNLTRLRADFNGLFQGGKVLCLSHSDTCLDVNGKQVPLCKGMSVTAYEENEENGERDDLLASGVVDLSPEWLQCRGSRWILRIDESGVRYESDLRSIIPKAD
jgi:hypothetical protein